LLDNRFEETKVIESPELIQTSPLPRISASLNEAAFTTPETQLNDSATLEEISSLSPLKIDA